MNKLHKESLDSKSLELLQYISNKKEFEDFYLVGGTALSLQIGHRISIDLDLFSQNEFGSNIIQNIGKNYKVIALSDNSVEVVVDDTKLFLFYFAFPKAKNVINIEGIKMADPVDIGLMKLLALQGRSTKKDIIDLFFIDKEIMKLEELLELFEETYPKESFNSYSSLQQLFDKEVLAKSEMPKMLKKIDWDQAYELVILKVARHWKKIIN